MDGNCSRRMCGRVKVELKPRCKSCPERSRRERLCRHGPETLRPEMLSMEKSVANFEDVLGQGFYEGSEVGKLQKAGENKKEALN